MEQELTAVLVAAVTGVFTFAGIIISSRKTTAIVNYRVGELEKKVDKHNHLVERMYCLEKNVAVQDKRIEDLEERGDLCDKRKISKAN